MQKDVERCIKLYLIYIDDYSVDLHYTLNVWILK